METDQIIKHVEESLSNRNCSQVELVRNSLHIFGELEKIVPILNEKGYDCAYVSSCGYESLDEGFKGLVYSKLIIKNKSN